ncbi:hypothetical protein C8Q74DRAFT_74201 [Fomes fomentarius]|nr:hypothetical protein C8Q74DRAFT_74201 [Fomes fomentarius]
MRGRSWFETRACPCCRNYQAIPIEANEYRHLESAKPWSLCHFLVLTRIHTTNSRDKRLAVVVEYAMLSHLHLLLRAHTADAW